MDPTIKPFPAVGLFGNKLIPIRTLSESISRDMQDVYTMAGQKSMTMTTSYEVNISMTLLGELPDISMDMTDVYVIDHRGMSRSYKDAIIGNVTAISRDVPYHGSVEQLDADEYDIEMVCTEFEQLPV